MIPSSHAARYSNLGSTHRPLPSTVGPRRVHDRAVPYTARGTRPGADHHTTCRIVRGRDTPGRQREMGAVACIGASNTGSIGRLAEAASDPQARPLALPPQRHCLETFEARDTQGRQCYQGPVNSDRMARDLKHPGAPGAANDPQARPPGATHAAADAIRLE